MHYRPCVSTVIGTQTITTRPMLESTRYTPQRHGGGVKVDLRADKRVLVLVERNLRGGTRAPAKLIRARGNTISEKKENLIKFTKSRHQCLQTRLGDLVVTQYPQ